MPDYRKEIEEIMSEPEIKKTYMSLIFDDLDKFNKNMRNTLTKLNDYIPVGLEPQFRTITLHHCYLINDVNNLKSLMIGE